jgi:hypothetical protein
MTATDDFADVPERYRGLWRRVQLDVPGLRDTTTWAHWLQTVRWHADLRVPDAARTAEVLGAPGHSPHPALALRLSSFQRWTLGTPVRSMGSMALPPRLSCPPSPRLARTLHSLS